MFPSQYARANRAYHGSEQLASEGFHDGPNHPTTDGGMNPAICRLQTHGYETGDGNDDKTHNQSEPGGPNGATQS